MKTIKTILVLLILMAVAVVAYVWSGLYPIGADVPHWSVTYEVLETLRDRSIAEHAKSIQVPVIDMQAQVAEGAKHYGEMCVGCHLAPGGSESEMRAGLYPQPPDLTEPSDLSPAEMFWTIKHGVKLSAMPAWGPTHSDKIIWSIVSFVRKLPGMTPEQYKALAGNGGEGDHHDAGGDEHHAGESDDHQDHGDEPQTGAGDEPKQGG